MPSTRERPPATSRDGSPAASLRRRTPASTSARRRRRPTPRAEEEAAVGDDFRPAPRHAKAKVRSSSTSTSHHWPEASRRARPRRDRLSMRPPTRRRGQRDALSVRWSRPGQTARAEPKCSTPPPLARRVIHHLFQNLVSVTPRVHPASSRAQPPPRAASCSTIDVRRHEETHDLDASRRPSGPSRLPPGRAGRSPSAPRCSSRAAAPSPRGSGRCSTCSSSCWWPAPRAPARRCWPRSWPSSPGTSSSCRRTTRFEIRDPKDWLSLVAFLVVGVIVGIAGRPYARTRGRAPWRASRRPPRSTASARRSSRRRPPARWPRAA